MRALPIPSFPNVNFCIVRQDAQSLSCDKRARMSLIAGNSPGQARGSGRGTKGPARRLLGFKTLVDSPRLVAFEVADRHVLLVFQRGATEADVADARGTIPGHDGAGRLRLALSIAASDAIPTERRPGRPRRPAARERGTLVGFRGCG